MKLLTIELGFSVLPVSIRGQADTVQSYRASLLHKSYVAFPCFASTYQNNLMSYFWMDVVKVSLI